MGKTGGRCCVVFRFMVRSSTVQCELWNMRKERKSVWRKKERKKNTVNLEMCNINNLNEWIDKNREQEEQYWLNIFLTLERIKWIKYLFVVVRFCFIGFYIFLFCFLFNETCFLVSVICWVQTCIESGTLYFILNGKYRFIMHTAGFRRVGLVIHGWDIIVIYIFGYFAYLISILLRLLFQVFAFYDNLFKKTKNFNFNLRRRTH